MKLAAAQFFWPWKPSDFRTSEEIEADIRAELTFHFEQMVADNGSRGLDECTALEQAAKRFGDLDNYAAACCKVQLGERVMLQRVLIAVSFALALLVGLLAWRVFSLTQTQRQVATLLDETRSELSALREDYRVDDTTSDLRKTKTEIAGVVRDSSGTPLAGANVLAIYKTWPNGQYRQQPTHTVTDSEGRFTLPELLPTQGQHALQIAIVTGGYALESFYKVNPANTAGIVEPVQFALNRASPVKVQVLGVDRVGIPGVEVIPHSRTTSDGQQHSVYFQGSEPARVTTDHEGYVELPYFELGDNAAVLVRATSGQWRTKEFTVEAGDESIEIVIDD